MYNCLLPISGYLIVRLQGPNCKLLDLRDCNNYCLSNIYTSGYKNSQERDFVKKF